MSAGPASRRGWRRWALVLAGAAISAGVGAGAAGFYGPVMLGHMQADADEAIRAAGGRMRGGVFVSFVDPAGWPSRRPRLSGGDALPDTTRARIADAVAAVPGVAGVWWAPRAPRDAVVSVDGALPVSLQCQSTVEAILKSRSIRFAEASATIDVTSHGALDEVAAALRPCAGSVIAITGHTDAKGDEAANLALSRDRAAAVRNALAVRGIDMAGLRARGLGSEKPLPGLDVNDPANRRIEFSVVAPVSPVPTVVDTPGPG